MPARKREPSCVSSSVYIRDYNTEMRNMKWGEKTQENVAVVVGENGDVDGGGDGDSAGGRELGGRLPVSVRMQLQMEEW